ncbi:MAG TPA: flagellar hook-associated protein FlgK, partial [Parvularculaceae bacterium]|nr:flagellar hook-associated protein FlgK [Parvularculaceae bacterium]
MTITSAMANATSGLSAAGKRADVVSNNIANASTPGYARREISVSEQILNGGGAGVSVDGVVRAQDAALTREKRSAAGVEARDEAIASAQQLLDKALGSPDDSFSLFNQYQGLETALRNLGETPESLSGQAATLDAAKSLAATFNQLAKKTQTAREDADATIAREVDQANAALKQIETLNAAISRSAIDGGDASALEDQRKSLIDQVSQLIPVREVPREDGRVDLITNEGVFLLSGSAKTISFAKAGVVTPDLSLAAGTLSGLSVGGVDITPGGTGAFAVKQGAIAGAFAVRDEVLPDFQAKIDGLAGDLIARFDGIDATLAPGQPGLFTDAGALFNPANTLGISARIAVNGAVDPDQGGALWRLRDGLGAATQGPGGDAD